MKRKKIDWNNSEVLKIIKDPLLSSQEKADKIGVSYSTLSHKRSDMGLKYPFTVGIDHKLTNREVKARYNAKIKKIGYKPLYTQKNNE